MRKSSLYLGYLVLNIVLLGLLLFFYPSLEADSFEKRREEGRQMVKELDITDLCLFTEARYTRHITQADSFTPFQDHPMSMDHFPSGSLVLPPLTTKVFNHEVD